MEIKGVVKQKLPVVSGEGGRGTWKKQSIILEVPGNFPKSVCIDIWGDNIDSFNINENEEIVASIDIESREYNGKWYTNVKAWRVNRPDQMDQAPVNNDASPVEDKYQDVQDEDDLPF